MVTQRAVKIQSRGIAQVVDDAAIPELPDDRMLVRTLCIALNPTDWKHTQFFPTPGATVGCDYSGVVHQVGKDVTRFQVGDYVFGWCHGSNNQNVADGSFAQYIVAWPGCAAQVPDNINMEQAATLGVGIGTIGQCLYQTLDLPEPTGVQGDGSTEPILIYGGSSSVGALAIQFAKLSGMRVVTTCSPRNFDFVRSLGADAVVDYSSPAAVDDIQHGAGGPIMKVLDCISEAATGKICGQAMAAGGHYVCINPVASLGRSDVQQTLRLAYTAFGRPINVMKKDYAASMEDRAFAERFMDSAVALVAARRIAPHPVRISTGGLEAGLRGLKEMRKGNVSAMKLVYLMEL